MDLYKVLKPNAGYMVGATIQLDDKDAEKMLKEKIIESVENSGKKNKKAPEPEAK